MEQENFDWKATIKINLLLLKLVGLWPSGDETYKKNLYSFYSVFILTFFAIGHNVLQTTNLFFIYKDLEALTSTVFLAIVQLLALQKAFYIIKNMGVLKNLMVTLNSELFQPKNFYQRKLVEPNLKSWLLLFKIYWSDVGIALLLMLFFPVIDNSVSEFRLPFVAWYPYDTRISPNYEITYLHQVLAGSIICTINVSTDTFIASLNMYIAAQCDLLCDNLRKINKVDFDQQLRRCVGHHQEILKFAQDSQGFFNWIVFMQFFTSILSIAFTMFQLSLGIWMSFEFYSLIFYLFSITLEIFTFCWFGNEVEIKSRNILYAIFESQWIDTYKQTKKRVFFFALRCQQPIQMSALNLFYLTLETFTNILKSSWSYFAVLNQLNARDN